MSGVHINGRNWVVGMCRQGRGHLKKSHLFDGTFSEPGLPMCRWAWNKYGEYSIWRNNVSDKGICSICFRRAKKGLKGVEFRSNSLGEETE